MIRKEYIEKPRDAFYWVNQILAEYKDYYLTKEEIYSRIPHNEEGVAIVTISALENALRNLAKMGHINIAYEEGRRYFGYREDKRYD